MNGHINDHDGATPARRVDDLWRRAVWARRATAARAAAWAADGVIDPGDVHDKGEPSLCVGEAG